MDPFAPEIKCLIYVPCRSQDIDYLELRFWIGMWLALSLLIMVAFDLSALVRYITRFTEESFAMLIAIIFIFEALNKQYKTMKHKPVNFHPDDPLDYTCICNMSFTGFNDYESTSELLLLMTGIFFKKITVMCVNLKLLLFLSSSVTS